jgi:Mitochondrial resolvase Ydc2 / RNA splicing MRS1
MKVLSIDVGIKNLAFCLFSKSCDNNDYKIEKWDVINIGAELEMKCCEIEKFKDCGKPAKYTKNGKHYCLKHCKKQPFQVPTSDLKPAYLNKQKIKNLYELAEKYNIKYEDPIKKADLVTLINNYIFEKCFDPIDATNSSKVDLITIGRIVKIKFDKLLSEHLTSLTHVVIENQISPIANRMKTIQGMIAQYFIMRNDKISIDFVSSANKLKELNSEEKISYSERKKLGVKKCLETVVNSPNYNSWENFFKSHKKNDDLADSFLQGIWFIKNKL